MVEPLLLTVATKHINIMKHIITLLAITFAAITLTSCGVATTITYGDISVLSLEGKTIRQWNNCSLEEQTSHYNPNTKNVETTRYYYGINKHEGLSFTDSVGETHYVSGGIIIVDNIRTTPEEVEYTEFEYKRLLKEYNSVSKLLKTHLRGGRGPGRMEAEQYDRMVAKKEYLAKRIALIESKMNETHYTEPDPKVEYNQLHFD